MVKVSVPSIVAIVGIVIAVLAATVVLSSDNVPWYPQDEWKDYDVDHVSDSLKVGDSYSFSIAMSDMEDATKNGFFEDVWTIEKVVPGGYEVSSSLSGSSSVMTADEFLQYLSDSSLKSVVHVVKWYSDKDTTKRTPFGYRNIKVEYSSGDGDHYKVWFGEDGVIYKLEKNHRYTTTDEDGREISKSDLTSVKLKSCNFLTTTHAEPVS